MNFFFRKFSRTVNFGSMWSIWNVTYRMVSFVWKFNIHNVFNFQLTTTFRYYFDSLKRSFKTILSKKFQPNLIELIFITNILCVKFFFITSKYDFTIFFWFARWKWEICVLDIRFVLFTWPFFFIAFYCCVLCSAIRWTEFV